MAGVLRGPLPLPSLMVLSMRVAQSSLPVAASRATQYSSAPRSAMRKALVADDRNLAEGIADGDLPDGREGEFVELGVFGDAVVVGPR